MVAALRKSLSDMPFFLWFDADNGIAGDDGKSAFELAIEHGYPYNPNLSYYVNEDNWLNSLKGEQGPSGLPAVYTYVQETPAAAWLIVHSFGFRPNVNVVDGNGEVVYCQITHVNTNQVLLNFAEPFAGIATLS